MPSQERIVLQPPAGHPRFPCVDSCRAIAALAIVLYHSGQLDGANRTGALGPAGLNLRIGVPIFFAISGFVLYRPFVNARINGAPKPALRDYARRRIVRIIPAYWAALTLLGLLAGWSDVFGPDFWRYYGLVQIYDKRTFSGGMGVAWSLCVEVSFYLLLPAYAVLIGKLRRSSHEDLREAGVLLVLGAASLVFRQAFGAHNAYSGFPTQTLPGTFLWFVPGMLLAIFSARGADAPAPVRWVIDANRATATWAIALALFLALAYAGLPEVAAQALTPVIALGVLLPAVAGGDMAASGGWRTAPQRMLSQRWLLWLGLVSYPIYLYHGTLMAWWNSHSITKVFFPPDAWVALVIASTLSAVAAATFSWYLVERPVLRYDKRRGSRRAGAIVPLGAERPEFAAPAVRPAVVAAPPADR